MGLIVPTTRHPEREDQPLPYEWFVGIDWGAQPHQVSVLDCDRRRVGARVVDHDGARIPSRRSSARGRSRCRTVDDFLIQLS